MTSSRDLSDVFKRVKIYPSVAQLLHSALKNEDLYSVSLSLLSLMENMGLSTTTFSLGKSEEEFSTYLMDGGLSLTVYVV